MEEKIENTAVIDASFMLCYLQPDEQLEKVQHAFERYKTGHLHFLSTQLFHFEVINGIYAAVLSKRLELNLARDLVVDFLKLPISLEQIDYKTVFEISLKHKISIYDASYLHLAAIKQIPLLTLDKKLMHFTSAQNHS